VSVRFRLFMLPSPFRCGLGPWRYSLSRPQRVYLCYGPVTRSLPWGDLVDRLQSFSFHHLCYPHYGALTSTPAGLSPAEHASLHWTHNGTYSFPAFRFHEWLREVRREGISETRLPCPPRSGPSASDLRTSNDRLVSSKRDVRVFTKGTFHLHAPLSSTSIAQSSIHSRTSFPDHSRSAVAGHASYSSRASGTITSSDS
jgi:hypothetical protein